MDKRFLYVAASLALFAPSLANAQSNPTPPIPPPAQPLASPAPAGAASTLVTGTVVDRSTGLSLSGVRVSAVGSSSVTTTDAAGKFQLSLPPGVYVFEARVQGYQAAQTDNVALTSNTSTSLTLSLNRAENQSGSYRQVARTTTRANDALQPAAVIQHTISAGDELARGTLRVDRAIEELPNVVFSTGLSTPGIDGYISLRGLPGETQQLIDGHPTTVSLNSVALFPFQSVNVIYGSGKGQLYPINAIGGVIDLRTLQPTRQPSVTFLQSFGTFNHLTSDIQSTGTVGEKLGYAFSLGIEGADAPYARTTRYEPLSGWDPSATDPAVRARSFYAIDSPYNVRSGFVKLQYAASPAFKVTTTVLGSAELHLNDGDKSVDYHTFDRVLADGNRNLANKGATDPCAAGTFTATNFNSKPNGFGPNGLPDGGITCQTPQQYAAFRAGYTTGELGSITTQNNDNDIKFELAGTRNYALVDIYASLFQRHQDFHSTNYVLSPGDLNNLHTKRTDDSNAGITISDDFLFPNDDFGIGYYSNNYRQDEIGVQSNQLGVVNGGYIFNYGNDIRSYFFKLIHHSPNSPFTIYASDYLKDSQQPHAFFNDPRLAVLFRRGNDTIRVAAGQGSSLPYAPDNQTYQPILLPQFTSGVNCNGGNSVGTAPTGFTKPERASDEEISFAHRWHGDSTTQLEFYNENFASKVQYGYNAPLTYTGTAFLSPAQLAGYIAAIGGKCGGTPTTALLTLQGNYNLGRQLARGIDLTGRQRVGRSVFFDYSYGTQSVAYRSLPLEVVQGDKRIIIGAQTFIPDSGAQIPLHSATLALDATGPQGLQARMTGFYTGPGNQNGLPGFIRTDLSVNKALSHYGSVNAYVYNLINYKGFYDNVNGYGIPLALNQYASASDYQPYFGAGAQNQYGIGPRTIVFTYQVKL